MELALLTDAYMVISIYDPIEYGVTTFLSHEISEVEDSLPIKTHERFVSEDVSIHHCQSLFVPS